MQGLADMLEKLKRENERDAQRYAEHNPQLCMLCGAYGEDKRSLRIDCFYRVSEAVPEALCLNEVDRVEGEPPKHRGYYLLICKSCRGRLLGHLRAWRGECVALQGEPKDHDGYLEEIDPERNIPVRIDGMIVMLTREEWDAKYAASEPVREGQGE